MADDSFKIGRIEKERFVIMRQFQALAEFWVKRNGALTVSYCFGYSDLSITDKIILNLQIQKFIDEEGTQTNE